MGPRNTGDSFHSIVFATLFDNLGNNFAEYDGALSCMNGLFSLMLLVITQRMSC